MYLLRGASRREVAHESFTVLGGAGDDLKRPACRVHGVAVTLEKQEGFRCGLGADATPRMGPS